MKGILPGQAQKSRQELSEAVFLIDKSVLSLVFIDYQKMYVNLYCTVATSTECLD